MPAARTVVGLSLLHQVLASGLAASVPVIMPELVDRAGLFEGLAGLYAMLMYVGAIVSAMAGEALFRRLGAATTSALACLVAAVGLVVFLPLTGVTFVAAAVVIGLGYGPVSPASSHLMAGIVGRRDLNLVFSIRQAGAPLGVLVTGLALPAVVLWLGWRPALLVFAASASLLALATMRVARRVDAGTRAPSGSRGLLGPLREVVSTPTLHGLAATAFLFSAMLATLNAFVPVAVSSLAGLDLAHAGACAAAAQGGAIAGRLLWGFVADRLLSPSATLATVGGLMAGATLALASLDTTATFPTVVAVSVWLGATAGGWGGVVPAQAARLASPGAVGRVASGMMVISFVGVMLGPPLVGGMLAWTGSFPLALTAVAAVGGLGGAIAWLMPGRSGAPPSSRGDG
ncbi:MAG: MFS transporter [Ectothiorhodospiraceae bacterium]|nr:MFS transporter [Chromatiales bacterium]MCP5157373.1 MFS transporter [Ectothiorhodospiraceae bacterium]